MLRYRSNLAGAVALAFTVHLAHAGPEECRQAVDDYDVVMSELTEALGQYEKCVTESNGEDICEIEFEHLQSAQQDFQTAVLTYQNECR
jgi:hypothetical protein